MVGEERRTWLYGEIDEGDHATRMIRRGPYKLIYYAAGNRRQLFDLESDPLELNDLTGTSDHEEVLNELTRLLVGELYGEDREWVEDGELVGRADRRFRPGPNRGLTSQRGHHWPPPPESNLPQIQWFSEA